MRLLRALLNASAGAGAFLAFGWPIVASTDPGDPAFKLIAIATLVVMLASLAFLIAAKARR